MKLSRLYSNRQAEFGPIDFVSGLNVVSAEIRLPENRDKDTHNLGKTTLGRLLDFCFLAGRDPKFFLFKHCDLFDDFCFYLEIELEDSTFVTIRRAVRDASKISFKKHAAGHQNFVELPSSGWDHLDVSFERAREILDGILDWRALKPWSFRKELGYLLRSQEDFREVFQLRKFASKHADWKPFLAQMLGFNAVLIAKHYEKEEEILKKDDAAKVIKSELGGSVEDIGKIEGLLQIKQKEASRKQELLDAFDFRTQDKSETKNLVEGIDALISALNAERYSLSQNRRKIVAALEDDQILFDPEQARQIFSESGVLFQGQIKRDFEQLIAFNSAISTERSRYLQEERADLEAELKRVNSELTALGRKRSDILSFLTGSDSFQKYKHLSEELIDLKTDIASLGRQREFLHKLQDIRAEIRVLAEECRALQAAIEADVEEKNRDPSSKFSQIRMLFNEIVEGVISRKALLGVSPNQGGHLEFKVEILDESGKSTSADLGYTYRKLLCVAFDLAVLRAHLGQRFPRFIYHDGVFESLDERKKQNLLSTIRDYARLGLQPIVTLIDSDAPASLDGGETFAEGEVILRLHDEDESGRLFRMRTW